MIVVAMPVRNEHIVPPELIEAARNDSYIFIDLRDTPGLPSERFRDNLHLDPTGAKIYSRHLADTLSPIFRQTLTTQSTTAP